MKIIIYSMLILIFHTIGIISLMTAESEEQMNVYKPETKKTSDYVSTDNGIILGDSLPEWFWEVELGVVNHPQGKSSVKLHEYKNKLLVLDFWATYCSPCVASLDKWDTLQEYFSTKVMVIGVHLLDSSHKAEPFAERKEWAIPIAVANAADTLLNKLFYADRRFGQVWIKDGKLLAIPKNKAVTTELVEAVINGEEVDIPMEYSMTYFEYLNPIHNLGDNQ